MSLFGESSLYGDDLWLGRNRLPHPMAIWRNHLYKQSGAQFFNNIRTLGRRAPLGMFKIWRWLVFFSHQFVYKFLSYNPTKILDIIMVLNHLDEAILLLWQRLLFCFNLQGVRFITKKINITMKLVTAVQMAIETRPSKPPAVTRAEHALILERALLETRGLGLKTK